MGRNHKMHNRHKRSLCFLRFLWFLPIFLFIDCPGIYYPSSEDSMKKQASFVIAFLLIAATSLSGADLRLIQAVKNSDAKAVRSLISQRLDVNATDVDSSTALHWAAQRNNPEIVDLLLAAGANAKAVTRYNITPLALAC